MKAGGPDAIFYIKNISENNYVRGVPEKILKEGGFSRKKINNEGGGVRRKNK